MSSLLCLGVNYATCIQHHLFQSYSNNYSVIWLIVLMYIPTLNVINTSSLQLLWTVHGINNCTSCKQFWQGSTLQFDHDCCWWTQEWKWSTVAHCERNGEPLHPGPGEQAIQTYTHVQTITGQSHGKNIGLTILCGIYVSWTSGNTGSTIIRENFILKRFL